MTFPSPSIDPESKANELCELFKLFGDSTRLRILCSLLRESQCVSDLCMAVQMNQSAVSHQLCQLKKSKLVSARRKGREMIYSLADDHVSTILAMGLEHVCENGKEDIHG